MISVAVPVPFLDPLSYRVPETCPTPSIGARVRVPVGTRTMIGCVIDHDASVPEGAVPRDILEVLDSEPLLPMGVIELCRWVADYYVAGVGDALALALPPGTQRRPGRFRHIRLVSLRDAPDTAHLTPKQHHLVQLLSGASTGLSLDVLRAHGISSDVVSRLAKKGIVTVHDVRSDRDPFNRSALDDVPVSPDRILTDEQAVALGTLAGLVADRHFRVALLHGVTGSGKTEIYLRLADRVRQAGGCVLMLVPEISLTPAIASAFRGVFGGRVAIQHSALSDGERHDQWHRIQRGDVDIVVGTRSAVFSPLERLALVIVDEEHDTSYKQEETPRYNGRDVAIVRARAENALVVLGSATPSIESYQNTVTGKYVRVTLERRVLDRPLATVRIVNMRDEYAESGPAAIIGRDLAQAIDRRLEQTEQVLVLLNRRGFATAVFCRQCGDTFECPNCSISLTVHSVRGGWLARCHYCGYSARVPTACRKCAAPYLEHAGVGTEQVEAQLRTLFPSARVGRIDRDAIRRKGALAALLKAFASRELDILVGTQMIAKGHDFPNVTLVGVVSADIGLGLADFRASERTFQLLTQVSGRAGRGTQPGEAIVQTLYPDHYSIQLACRQDYGAFFDREIVYRQHMRYPPYVSLVNGVVRGRTLDEAMRYARSLVEVLDKAGPAGGFSVLGPAPAPLSRLRGEHRVQFLLKGSRRAEMRHALVQAVAAIPDLRRRLTIDIDPVSVL